MSGDAFTETEARTKWCPHMRGWDSTPDGTFVTSNLGAMCIASACMAWRTVPALTVDNPARVVPMQGQSVDTSRGYCGLAGRP